MIKMTKEGMIETIVERIQYNLRQAKEYHRQWWGSKDEEDRRACQSLRDDYARSGFELIYLLEDLTVTNHEQTKELVEDFLAEVYKREEVAK